MRRPSHTLSCPIYLSSACILLSRSNDGQILCVKQLMLVSEWALRKVTVSCVGFQKDFASMRCLCVDSGMDLPLLYHFSNGYYTELSRNYKHTVHAVQCPIRRILAALWRWLGSLASDLVSKSCLNQTLNMSAGTGDYIRRAYSGMLSSLLVHSSRTDHHCMLRVLHYSGF